MGIGRKATDQRTRCRKFLAMPLLTASGGDDGAKQRSLFRE